MDEKNGYITINHKKNNNFQSNLANMASADCKHDFGINITTQGLTTTFNSGLPSEAKVAPSEDDVLDSLSLINADFKQFLTTTAEPKDLIIQYPDAKDSITEYTVIKYPKEEYETTDFAEKFIEKTNLFVNTENACFVVDFNQHGFMSKMKEGKTVPGTIHYLMTPEVVNDPAGKPSIFDNSIFNNSESGVNMVSYIQTTPETTEYTPFSKNNDEFANNFFSNYNLSLSPVQQTFQKGNISKLNTSLTITYSDNGKPYINTITDSKKQNSINSLTGFINNLIGKITKKSTPIDRFNFNSKLQQKRGGDWFQALCCLNVNNKDFTSILPNNKLKIDFSGPVYLVTHDRIALGFALLNGVNVIYLAHNKDTFVFQNKYNKIIRENSVPIEQSIYNQLSTFVTSSGRQGVSEYSTFEKNCENYETVRTEMITLCSNDLTEKISAANTILMNIDKNLNVINDPMTKITDYKNSFKLMIENIKPIFKSALLYSYILQNLPDISKKKAFLNDFFTTFIDKNKIIAYESLDGSDLLKAREYKNSIQSSLDKLGSISKADLDQAPINIKNNLEIVLGKMTVYDAVQTLFSDITTKPKFMSRIKSMVSGSESVAYEQYIFIPFITNLPVIELTNIVNFFENNFKPIIDSYKNLLEKAYEGKRTKPDEQQTSMFLRPANLISEIVLILKPCIQTTYEDYKVPFDGENLTTYGEQEIILNESTDVMVVNMDTESRTLDKTDKSSSSIDVDNMQTAIDANSQLKIGGSLSKLNEISISNSSIGIVYDSNITQIIWDLMSFNICKSTYSNNIFEYIEKNYKDQTEESADDFSTLLKLLKNQRQPGPTKRGGTLTNEKNILRDTSFCFHPLLPIYINLTSFYNQIGPDFNGDPFYETYIQYVNVLEKMTDVIIENYLKENDLQKNLEGYLIGYSLKTVFFTANKSKKLFEKLKSLLGLTAHEMRMFCMKNDIFGGQIVGNYIVNENDREELIGILLLSIPVISKFLKEEVKMNNEINKPLNKTQIKLISNYKNRVYYTKNLKSHIESVLNKITNKINKDRTGKILETPMNSSTASTDSEKSGVPAPPSDKSKKQKNSIPTKEMENELYPTVFGFPKKPLAAHGGTKKHIKKPKINTKRTKRLRFIHKK
jgi:hypothetical protein